MPELPTDRNYIADLLKTIYPFRDLEEELQAFVADQFGIYNLEREHALFREGTPAREAFIVLNGQLRITRMNEKTEEEELVATLTTGDWLGLEALVEEEEYQVSAVSVRSARVLSLNLERLDLLMEEIGGLGERLEMLYNSYMLGLRTRLTWRNPGEPVYYIARRHPFYLILRLLPPLLVGLAGGSGLAFWYFITGGMLTPLILGGLFLLLILMWSVWAVVDWSNDYAIITSQRVLFQERIVLLYDSRQESPINAILAISTETTQLGRIFKFGNVIVRTYAGLIKLPELRYPEEVASLLEGQWGRAKAGLTRAERMSQLENKIRQRLGLPADYEKKDMDEQPAAPKVEPAALQRFLANLFQLRFEQGGAITYRTHWWILIRHTWLPALILWLAQLALVARALQVFTLFTFGGVLGLVAVIDLVVGLWLVYQYVDWRNDYYQVTDENLLDVYRKPLGKEERRAAPIKNIQSIRFERLGIVGLLLNFGTVWIKVGDAELTFDYVFNPSEVQREIFKRMAEREYRNSEAAMQTEEQRLADWIEAYHNVLERKRYGDIPVSES